MFEEVYKQARAQGYLSVAHAGEEGPAEYVWEALKLLRSQRIDHGVRSVEDPELLQYLKEKRIPLTVCPLSNVKLRVFPSMKNHNIKDLLNMGLCVTINSDDPAYFGGYMNENFIASQRDLGLTRDDLYRINLNSIEATFLDEPRKAALKQELDDYFGVHG